ncbi:MAG TPA: DUF6789 family protein [Kofleriaceae bacterium]|nr:DUF6789 family protein [Kofleriaceae bacterium]
MTTVLQKLEQGISAGTLATMPMTAVMLGAQRLGLLGKAPPAKITDAALDAADVPARRSERALATALAHFGFGAAAGAIYSVLRPGTPSLARGAIEGAVFATGVWAASYAGWVPALGIMPPPKQDRPGRPASMIVAHWVFGAVLGMFVAARRK